MRNGQNKRMRGRNNRKSHNPLTRVYESNGPDVKIRGTAHHVAEKYLQLARDAQSSGDPIAAENYFQHAEHYFRLIAAAQEQFRQNQPFQQRPEGGEQQRDEGYDDGDDDSPSAVPGEAPFGTREPQPYIPREAQPFPQQRESQHYQPREHRSYESRPQPQQGGQDGEPGAVDRLPAFITGGGQQPQQGHQQNGYESQPDRFPLHRRRRRHRGPRPDMGGGHQGMGSEPDEPAPPATPRSGNE